MRYAAMQVLTWGTIAGAIGSALLLASLEMPHHNGLSVPLDPSGLMQREAPQAGPKQREAPPSASGASAPAASGSRP